MTTVLLWSSFLCCASFSSSAATSSVPSKAVVVILDDSGSMSENGSTRWIRANYALKALAGLLDDTDSLTIFTLNGKEMGPYHGSSGIKQAILELDRFKNTSGNTPYGQVTAGLTALIQRKEAHKWFVVITDGGFNDGFNATLDAQNQARALATHIHSAFITIEQQSSSTATAWERNAGAKVFNADKAEDIETQLRKAATWLNGQADTGVAFTVDGDDLLIDSAFPLRRLTFLRQDSLANDLGSASIMANAIPPASLRQHLVTANVPIQKLHDTRIYHLKNPDGRVITPGKSAIRLGFPGVAQRIKGLLLPDVAAQFSLSVEDANGASLTPDKAGVFTICDANYHLSAYLVDGSGSSLLSGRNDLPSFAFEAVVDSKIHPLHEKGGNFTVMLPSGAPGSEVHVTASAKYPGYFHKTATPLTLRFAECKRDIVITVVDESPEKGTWQSNITRLDQAPFLKMRVTTDGKPVSAAELGTWRANWQAANLAMDVEFGDGEIRLRPKSFCCVWWWKNAGPGEYSLPLNIETGKRYDVIKAPAKLNFRILRPPSQTALAWWYACPFVLLSCALALFWYVQRLVQKSRFGRNARFEANEELADGVRRPRTTMLREQSNMISFWLWPSSATTASAFGIRFKASGDDVIASGDDLNEKHRIPGWYFDRSRKEALRKSEQRQDDALISNNSRFEIQDINKVIRITYKAE